MVKMVGTDSRTVGLSGYRIWWIMMEDMTMPSSWRREEGHDVNGFLKTTSFIYFRIKDYRCFSEGFSCKTCSHCPRVAPLCYYRLKLHPEDEERVAAASGTLRAAPRDERTSELKFSPPERPE